MNVLVKPFEPFLETIKIADELLDGYKAYRMDGGAGRPDMRKDIELGGCHCCDYLIIREDTVILIEETRLMKTIENYQEEYDAMVQEDEKNKFYNRRIRDENILKVYGSLIVLLLWKAAHDTVSDLINGKRYNFWLVASDVETDNNEIAFDNMRDRLFQGLRSALKKSMFDDAEILTPSQLQSKLTP